MKTIILTAALRRYSGKPCPYCRRTMHAYPAGNEFSPTRDHIRPKSHGGTEVLICCTTCNGDKKALSLEEWLHKLRLDGDVRATHVAQVAADHPLLAVSAPDRIIAFSLSDMHESGAVWTCKLCERKFLTRDAARMHAESPKHTQPRLTDAEALLAELRGD